MMAQSTSETDSIMLTNAFMLNQAGKYKEALEGFLKVGQNTKKQRTEDERQVYVLSQTMAIMCYEQLKKYEEGFRLSEALLKGNINEDEKKDIQHLYVMNGYFVATSFINRRFCRYADARDMLAKILPYADDEMRQRIMPKIPLSWYFEGAYYLLEQSYVPALACMEKAQDGYHKIGATKDEIDALCQIGTIKNHLYDINGATETYQQACELAVAIKDDGMQMEILRELYKLKECLGDNEQTLMISLKMDSLAETTENNEVRFEYYRHLGNDAKGQGNFSLAEQWFRKNDSYINHLGNDYIGSNKYIHYANLRDLYAKWGKYNDALKYADLNKKEHQRALRPTDKDYYTPYENFANIYKHMGDSAQCFKNLDTLFISIGRMTEPREKKNLYVTRALCHSKFKNYELALADYKKADKLLSTKYDEDDGDRIMLLSLMGGMEHQLGRYDESERLYRKYAEAIRKLYGENHANYIDALGYLANAEGFSGHIEAACNDYTIAAAKLKQQIQNKLPYLTTVEREGYWKSVSELILNMTPFALEAKEFQTAFTRSCYDGLVLSKAFLLESERSTFELIKNNGTSEDLRDFTKIAAMQSRIREWEKNGNEYADSILELTSKIKQQESLLAGKCRSYGNLTSFMSIGYQEIKEKLNDGDVLLDFTDYISKSKGRTYAAYIINKQQEYPMLKKLFTESKIDSLQVCYPDMFYKSPYAENIYQLLWIPFKEYVKEGATVYYVPSHFLFQIALESLPLEDGTLLGEHYHFVRLSSARELVNLRDNLHFDFASGRTGAVLYGGLKYDLEKKIMEKEAKKYDISPLLAFRGGPVRGDSIFHDLPNSLKEVLEINQILKSCNISVKPYTGINGTEESFLNMNSRASTILHLSTHGFYYTPDNAKNINYLRGYSDAMSLSGIVMAGGNKAWLGKEVPKGVLGGILTAADISRLDLTDVELLVLSACHSGRGEATSEGLYGLQRAFKKAGCKTMILSLWEVSDVVGTEFMTAFYKYLSDNDNHWNKRAAFEKAKSDIRKKYPKDPFYWACFVMLD